MIISGVKIILSPNTEAEKNMYPRGIILSRDENKLWTAEESDGVRGLYPYEVRLANDIQELIIQKFNGKVK